MPIVAIVVFVGLVGAILATAGDTLGYDFLAYHAAAQRLLDGRPLYDPGVRGRRLRDLPVPADVRAAILPVRLLARATPRRGLAWRAMLVASSLRRSRSCRSRPTVRWSIAPAGRAGLAGAYSIKLGQVGPILLLLFALGWRWLDRPRPGLGASGLGALIKVQPALVGAWAVLTGRWRAA